MSIQEIKVPVLAESVADATLLNWCKKPGEAVQESEKLVEIETDKVVLEVVAHQAGTLTEILKADGDNVLSEEVIARLDSNVAPTVTSPTPVMEEKPAIALKVELAPSSTAPAKTSPAVRKLATEQGIEPGAVPHHGDRVTKADVLKIQKPSVSPSSQSDASVRVEERVPMTRLRKRVAERLLNAQHEHAILTTFNEINMKPTMDLRKKYKDVFEKKHGVKLGFMSFFTKAAVAALQKFPVVNASTEGDDIIYHGYYDIGIAVSSPRGLVVPILRDVDAMSFADVEKGITDFGRRARDAQLSLDDLTGGTFTITNGGIFGSMLSTPILNPPQSAILGMHNIVERPIAENGQVVIRPVMYVALSYDHRLVDGRDAVQFLVAIKNALEDPSRLLLDV
ncbi:2-oxoglutarate dehydrogenase complex dihydrolipoyllysine-residue succinyltransferase [Candidatus Parabeggiatoa sp. HSG14]|uniref:2-oxoglutarate dehydrogenase complex dihydrolipoyllysine-residue succinyltransferase n=1 Tax=Candidatus Parabeggiatoa sp. HSG14 TaxID=3055593 RepID=UPI0025A6EC70|nr:2-oxoglutarate dehydrogenase complex dihydrolipoyllysine-residue succinyltransferase [Thiotrichales bacterium HSG14]